MTENDRRFVGEIPQHYDAGLGPVIFEPYAKEIVRRVCAIGPKHVLELAAGTGIVSCRLRNALPDAATLTVTDLNAPMLAIAQKKIGAAPNVRFETADAMALQFHDSVFDLIVCQFGVMFFPDKVDAFRQALRVLQPGGAYLFNAWATMAENSFSQIAYDAQAAFYERDPPQFYRAPFSYPDPDTVARDVRSAGFSTLQHEAVSIDAEIVSWERFARGIIFGNPSINELIERGVDPETVAGVVASRLEKQWGAAPATMPIKAHFYAARAPG